MTSKERAFTHISAEIPSEYAEAASLLLKGIPRARKLLAAPLDHMQEVETIPKLFTMMEDPLPIKPSKQKLVPNCPETSYQRV